MQHYSVKLVYTVALNSSVILMVHRSSLNITKGYKKCIVCSGTLGYYSTVVNTGNDDRRNF